MALVPFSADQWQHNLTILGPVSVALAQGWAEVFSFTMG